MRNFLDAILSFIGSESLTNEETQQERGSPDATAGGDHSIVVNSGFKNANQAWENFHQIERRYGRKPGMQEKVTEAKNAPLS